MGNRKESSEAGPERGSSRGPDGAGADDQGAPSNPPRSIGQVVRSRSFLLGFIGWYLIVGGLWFLAKTPDLLCLMFAAHLIILPILVFNKARPAQVTGLGVLTALAVNFVVTLVLGVVENGFCFVPFFIPGVDLAL